MRVIELKGSVSCPKCKREYRTAFILYTCDVCLLPKVRVRGVIAVDTTRMPGKRALTVPWMSKAHHECETHEEWLNSTHYMCPCGHVEWAHHGLDRHHKGSCAHCLCTSYRGETRPLTDYERRKAGTL